MDEAWLRMARIGALLLLGQPGVANIGHVSAFDLDWHCYSPLVGQPHFDLTIERF